METVMGMVVREGYGHEVYPYRGESFGAGGTVELGGGSSKKNCGCVVRWLRLHPVMGVDYGEGHVGVSSGYVARRGGGDVARGRGEGLSRPSGPKMRSEGIAGRERRKNGHRSRWKSLYVEVRRLVDSSPTDLHST